MTLSLLQALLPQVILIIGGWGLIQILFYDRKVPVIPCLPFAWAAGIMILFVFGGILVRIPLLQHKWHFVVSLIALLLFIIAIMRRKGIEARFEFNGSTIKPSWLEYLFVAVILIKTASVTYIVMVNPVIDSDAANLDRWMGLSKYLHYHGYLDEKFDYTDHLFPSLLAVWTSHFMTRWFDNLACLPWVMTYLGIVSAGFTACYFLTKNRLAAVCFAYLISSVPLLNLHVIRPGYADIYLTLFVLIALSLLLAGIRERSIVSPFSFLSLVAIAACFLVKKEGTMWGIWLLVTLISFGIHKEKGIRWTKIFTVLLPILAGIYVIYYFASDYLLKNYEFDEEIIWLLRKDFQVSALRAFFEDTFAKGTFNLWWWFYAFVSVFLLIKSKHLTSKMMTVYMLMPYVATIYFTSFTGNVGQTLISTNAGRFLLQILPVFFPLYVCLMEEFLPAVQDG